MKWIDENTISFEWCVDDVLQTKKDYAISDHLSTDDCREILDMCLVDYDCNLGVTWELLVFYINEFLEIKKSSNDT